MKIAYENENVTLWHGDCREVIPTLQTVASVVTDPPYEIRNKFGISDLYGTRRMEFAFDVAGVTRDVVVPAMLASLPKASSFHCWCDPEQYAALAATARECGYTPKPFAKVKKCPPPPMPGNWWPSGFELAMYGYRPGAWFGDDSGKRVNVIVADSYRHGIRADEKEDHPTQKWLPMMLYIVTTIVPPGATVLDPFCGSGTTLIAALETGRKAIGIEIDERWVTVACRRLERWHAQGRLDFGTANDRAHRTGARTDGGSNG